MFGGERHDIYFYKKRFCINKTFSFILPVILILQVGYFLLRIFESFSDVCKMLPSSAQIFAEGAAQGQLDYEDSSGFSEAVVTGMTFDVLISAVFFVGSAILSMLLLLMFPAFFSEFIKSPLSNGKAILILSLFHLPIVLSLFDPLRYQVLTWQEGYTYSFAIHCFSNSTKPGCDSDAVIKELQDLAQLNQTLIACNYNSNKSVGIMYNFVLSLLCLSLVIGLIL